MLNNQSFEQKLHTILVEGLNPRRGPGQGSDIAIGNIPAEFAAEEPEVELEFDWQHPETRTYDYPGSPGGVSITKITLPETGRELDPDQIPDALRQHFEQTAIDYLDEKDERALGSYEDNLDARREDDMMRHREGW